MKSSILVQELILKGLSNKEIADKVCITVGAVKYHITKLLREHSCKSRAELILALQVKGSKILEQDHSSNQDQEFRPKYKD